ncbi:Smr/MutS family protein [Phreatobacter sp.]|uniref:Smr/MutS family protein n=1 Tax=Phreatobacter sp. TaxID=1966341 RepID=UPI003F7044E1
MKGRRPKGLSADDRKVWQHVTASVTPLDPVRALPAEPEPEPEPVAHPIPVAAPAIPARPVAAALRRPLPAAPPLAPLEKTLRRRLARGAAEPEARIDLHGLTQDAAHRRLIGFLRRSQAEGLKLVVVITGKGSRTADPHAERGVLRRVVPEWLMRPDLRALVIGFEEAAAAHGGGGALYVRIRRGVQPGD